MNSMTNAKAARLGSTGGDGNGTISRRKIYPIRSPGARPIPEYVGNK